MADCIPPGWFRTINWLDEVILLAVYVAETALLWLIVASIVGIGEGNTDPLSAWVLFGLIVASSLIPRLLEQISVWDPWYQVAIGLMIALSGVVTIKVLSYPDERWLNSDWIRDAVDGLVFRPDSAQQPVWAGIAIVAIVWWRSRTRETPTVDSSYRLLRAGFLIAFVGLAIFALSAHRSEQSGSAAAVLVFFTSATAAVGLCRAASADRLGYEKLTPRGVATALFPALATAIGAVVLAGIFTRDVVSTLFWAMGPLLWVIGLVLQGIVLVIAVIVLIILSPFILLLQGRTPDFQAIRLNTQTIFTTSDAEETASHFDLVPDPIRYVLAAIVLILIFGGVTKLALRRKSRRQSAGDGSERETMRPVFDLRGIFAALINAFGFRQKVEPDDSLASLRGDPRWTNTVLIRESYIRFLDWSANKGYGRRESMTPIEHSQNFTTNNSSPDPGPLGEMITTYNRARYGNRPASAEEANQVLVAWSKLQKSSKADS